MQSLLFLTVHKAASRFFGKSFLPRLARNTGLEHVDPEEVAWRNDIPKDQIEFDGYADRTDCILGPVRIPKSIRKAELFDGWRKVLLLRDPRDVLTSYYFSMAYSHTPPKGEALGARFEAARAQTVSEPIDEFVLRLMPMVHSRFENYRVRFSTRPNVLILRYEDMIQDWDQFGEKLMEFTGLTTGPAWSQRMHEFGMEFSVAEEIPTAHKRQVKAGDHVRKLNPETIEALNEQFAVVLDWLEYPQNLPVAD